METGKQQYIDDANRWLDYWTVGVNGQRIPYSPGGQAVLDSWGSLRYAANTSFVALVYSDWLTDATRKARYHDFGVRQINYALGDNPRKSSYVVGFGANPPQNPHHRTAHGSWLDSLTAADRDAARPVRRARRRTQRPQRHLHRPAVRLHRQRGGHGLQRRVLERARAADAGVRRHPAGRLPRRRAARRRRDLRRGHAQPAPGGTFTEVKAMIRNQSAFPARALKNGTLRYWFTLDSGDSAANLTLSANYSECGPQTAKPVSAGGTLYYAELSCVGQNIYPGGQSQHRRELQFRVTGGSTWNAANDASSAGLQHGAGQDQGDHALRRRQAHLGHRAHRHGHRHDRAERPGHPRGVRHHLDRRVAELDRVDRRGQRGRRVRRLPGAGLDLDPGGVDHVGVDRSCPASRRAPRTRTRSRRRTSRATSRPRRRPARSRRRTRRSTSCVPGGPGRRWHRPSPRPARR